MALACEAGASGVLVGRSVWAPAASLAPHERDAFLAGEGRRRLAALAELVDALGRPWTEASPLARLPDPPERWYLEY